MKTSRVYHENQCFLSKEVLNVLVIIVCLTNGIVSADVFLDAGDYQTCGITADGNIACWGNNSAEPIPTTIEAPFTQISGGLYHTCVINQVKQMNCWVNTTDSLVDDAPPPPLPVEYQEEVLQVSVGDDDICALTSNRDINCWNYNLDSQTLTSISKTGPFKQVSVGSDHACALTEQGTVTCWGNDDFGQASSEKVVNFKEISAAGYHTCGLLADGSGITCWGDYSNEETPVSEDDPFISISAGFSHTCAALKSGLIKCWGDDPFGEVSLPSQAEGKFIEVSVGFNHTCAVKVDGSVNCWGDDFYNQIKVPDGLVVKVTTSTDTTTPPPTDSTTPPPSDAPTPPPTDSTTPPPSDAPTPPPTDSTTPPPSDAPTPPPTDSTTPPSEPESCESIATYSNETRQVQPFCVEIPLYTDFNGQAILSVGLFSATLGIPFGFSDIRVETLTFIKTIAQPDPYHARFTPEDGLLTIPVLKVPTIVPYLKSEPISGPVVQCNAKLQQSILRPDVLSLIEFNCELP